MFEGSWITIFGGGFLVYLSIALFLWILTLLFYNPTPRQKPIRVRLLFVPQLPTRHVGVLTQPKGVVIFLQHVLKATYRNWLWESPEKDRHTEPVHGPRPNFGGAEAVMCSHCSPASGPLPASNMIPHSLGRTEALGM